MPHRLIALLLLANCRSPRRSPIDRAFRFIPSLLLGLAIGWAGGAIAQTSPTSSSSPAVVAQSDAAPTELVEVLAQIDAAASQGDLQAVMALYSPNFLNTDGMTYDDLQQNLQELWQRFPGLTYETTIDSWERENNGIVAETTTQIRGQQTRDSRPESLTATITSRQLVENGQVMSQEILTEESRLSQGNNPPTIEVILPDQVMIGQPFGFDAIVQEPLGDRILLGAALDESIEPDGYFNEIPINLEVLNSGGLFKVGRAPAIPAPHWISAVIIREDGITTVTRRLQVVRPNQSTP